MVITLLNWYKKSIMGMIFLTKDWYENYGLELEVLESGGCRAYHKKGQKFLIDDYTSPKGLCIEVIHAFYPQFFAMLRDIDMRKLGSKDGKTKFLI